MNRAYTLFFLISAFSASLVAQSGNIRGVVSDSANGERLAFVSVMISGTKKGTTTNTNGFYLLAGILPGKYDLVVTSLSYKKTVLPVNIVAGSSVVVNVRLQPDDVKLSEVVIESERTSKMMDISASMHVMNPEELQKIPVAVQGDLLRAVQVLPGIVSTSDVNAKYYVRGGSGDQNLILFDGMKVYNPFHAFGVFSVFDPDLINSTEVFTGAFPAGFGNRLSSVINVTSRSGNTMRLSGVAEINSLFSKVQIEGPISKNVSAIAHFRRSVFKDAFKTFLKSDVPLSFYDGFAKLTYETDENVRYTGEYFYTGDDVKGETSSDASYKWRSESYAGGLSTLISDRLFLHSMLFSTRFLTQREISSNALVSNATSEIKEFGLKAYFTAYTEEESQYHFGFEFSVPEFTNSYRNSANIPVELETAALDLSLWLRYEYSVDRLKYDAGVHVVPALGVDYGMSLNVIQPRVNISFLLQENLLTKISYGKFSQNAISLNNEEDVISLFESWTNLPKGIRASVSDHYVTGFEYRYRPLSNFTLQAYYKTYASLSLYNRNKIAQSDPDYLPGEGYSYGTEVLVRHAEESFELLGTYTLGWTRVTVDNFTYSPRYDRRHTINLAGSARPVGDVEISVRWEIGSGLPFTQTTGFYDRINISDPVRTPLYNMTGTPIATLGEKNAARLPWYHRMDFGLHYSYTFGKVKTKVGVNVINVYDQRNILYYDRYSAQTVNMLPFYPTISLRAEF